MRIENKNTFVYEYARGRGRLVIGCEGERRANDSGVAPSSRQGVLELDLDPVSATPATRKFPRDLSSGRLAVALATC